MRHRTFLVLKACLNFFRERGDILRVFKNGDRVGVVVCDDSLQTLQHFVTADLNLPIVKKMVRKQCAPSAVCVQDGADAALFGQNDMQHGFSR